VVAQEVGKGNARYLTFSRPSALPGAEDFPVVIALYPHEDLIWKGTSGAGVMSPFFDDRDL
jgi:hypothetical protein